MRTPVPMATGRTTELALIPPPCCDWSLVSIVFVTWVGVAVGTVVGTGLGVGVGFALGVAVAVTVVVGNRDA
jgi:hypothetical protein